MANMIRDDGKVAAVQVSNAAGWEEGVPDVLGAYLEDPGISSTKLKSW